jgi:hypothetical protein
LLTDGNRRARSLSRGESVTRRWPPTPGQTEQDGDNMAQALTKPVETAGDSFLKQGFSATASPISSPSRITISSRSPHQAVLGKSLISDKKEDTSIWKAKTQDPVNASYADEQSEALSEGSAIPSVKERMLAFHNPQSKPTVARNFQTKSYPVQHAKKQHPPKIDIYSDVKRQEEDPVSPITVNTRQDDYVIAREASYVPPSPAAAMAANTAAELVRRQKEQRQVTRTPTGLSGKSTDPFTVQPKPALAIEISGADASGGMHVKTPSRSINGAGESSPRDVSAQRRSTWSDRGSVAGIPATNERASTGSTDFPTPEQLDKMIEERVQARVSILETKMLIRMQQMENLMDERMNSRMELLESKIDKLSNMLTTVISNYGKFEI